MSGKAFYLSSASFLFGALLFSFTTLPKEALLASLGTAVLIFVLALIFKLKWASFGCGLLACFFIGGYLVELAQTVDTSLDSHIGQSVSLEGYVCDEPQVKDTALRFCFDPEDEGEMLLLTSGRYPEYEYGDRLSIKGKLIFPENFESYPGGPIFDYVSYLAKDGIRYVMYRPDIEKMSVGGKPIKKNLIEVKKLFVERMEAMLPEPESSLLGGILLGDRQGISEEIKDDFKEAGLIHILVLSGYNVTIVAEGLMKVFSFFPRSASRIFGAASIIGFAIMTGASATTVRASIMALILILAKSTSRRYDVSRALLAAAVIMVVENPLILGFDVSFQLSFLATLGLIYISPLISDKIEFLTERFGFREIVASSLGVQIAVAPYILYSMGTFSIVAIASNLSVLPVMPAVMLSGFVSVALSFVFGMFALPLSWAVTALLSYVLSVARIFSSLPFSSIYIRAGVFAPALMYAILIVFVIRAWRRRSFSRESSNLD